MNRLFWVLFCATALSIACVNCQEALDGTFEVGQYFVALNFPNFTLHAKFRNGSIYQDQYVAVNLLAVEEGVARQLWPGIAFDPTKSYTEMDIRSNYTVNKFQDTVALSNGTVVANREVLQVQCILPNGANLTLQFETYDKNGTLPWGTNTVSIHAGRIKYTALITDWTFDVPTNRIRLMIMGQYVSGPYDTPIPSWEQVGWDGPARRLVITWDLDETSPLDEVVFDTDVWAVADGNVSNIALAPNPVNDLSYVSFETSVPKSQSVTFGYILPRFAHTLAWDPNVLLSLFSTDPTEPQFSSRSSSNFDRNRNIIIGCVIGGVVLITAIIAVTVVLIKKSSNSRSRLHVKSTTDI